MRGHSRQALRSLCSVSSQVPKRRRYRAMSCSACSARYCACLASTNGGGTTAPLMVSHRSHPSLRPRDRAVAAEYHSAALRLGQPPCRSISGRVTSQGVSHYALVPMRPQAARHGYSAGAFRFHFYAILLPCLRRSSSMSGRILERWHDDGRGAGMGKSPPTQFVCEMVGGNRTSITFQASTLSLRRGGVEADRPSNIRALMSTMPWACWQQDTPWSR